MKLVLVNLYPVDTMAGYLLSSYMLKAYLAESFKDDDLSVEVLDFRADTDPRAICERIASRNAECVGFSCYCWNVETILDVAHRLRGQSRSLHVFGGPEITPSRICSFPDPNAADFYVIGEGEKKLANLVRYLQANADADRSSGHGPVPKGVAVWDGDRLVYEEDTDRILDLDEIPSVYLSGAVDERLYARQQAFLETQRGCRFKCKYCVYHRNLPTVSYASLERVSLELDHLIVEKNVRALRVFDSVFTSDLRRAKSIVRHLQKLKETSGTRLPWIYWEFTYDRVDEEFLRLVASLKYKDRILNVAEVSPLDRPQLYSEMLKDYTAVNCVGIQSLCGPALRAVGRARIKDERLAGFMELIRSLNLVLKVDIILGLPFETVESFFDGLEFLLPYFRDTDHILNVHRLQVLPGSELEGLCETYGIVYSREAPHLVYSTNCLSAGQLEHASRLTAVLFRMVNSPLRALFFEARDRLGEPLTSTLERILRAVESSPELEASQLVQGDVVDDDYWNGRIFEEIPSQWLADLLERMARRSSSASRTSG